MNHQSEMEGIIKAMQEKAENAYLNGEIATARHLSVIALENWPDNAPIAPISWCFSILIHCYKGDTDYYWLSDRFCVREPDDKQNRFSEDGTDYSIIIEFLIQMLQSPISQKMMEQWRNTFLEISEPKLNDDVSTALLLETAIEMMCYFKMDDWQVVANHFVSALEETYPYVSQEAQYSCRRLSLQIKLLKGERVTDDEICFLSPIERCLARAWELYFNSDFLPLNELMPQLSTGINCDSEFFLSVQGLITVTEFSREIAKRRNKDAEDLKELASSNGSIETDHAKTITGNNEDNDNNAMTDLLRHAKYYRYQRYGTERPLSAFLLLREKEAELAAAELREKLLLKDGISSECWTLFRFIPFLWSSALKYWDLSSLVKMYELEMEFHWSTASYFADNEYRGNADHAVDAIICGIKSMNSRLYKRKDAVQMIEILERYGTAEGICRLYQFIFQEATPVSWNLCVEWLRLLGDILPENLVSSCIDWTIKYHKYAEKLLTAWNTEEYYYLHPILQHYELSEDQHNALTFHFTKMFERCPNKLKEFQIVLQYLADHDWQLCQEMMGKSLEWEENAFTRTSIINICLHLVRYKPDAKAYCLNLLRMRGERFDDDIYLRYANIIQNESKTEKADFECVYGALEAAIQTMRPDSYNSQNFRQVYDQIEGVDWQEVESGELCQILELAMPILLGEKQVQPMNRVNILQALRIIFQSAKKSAQGVLANALLCHMEIFKCLFQDEPSKSDVWDTFLIKFYDPVYLYNELLLTFCQIYDGMTVEQKGIVLSYVREGLCYYPQHTYYPTYLCLRASSDDDSLHNIAEVALTQIKTIVQNQNWTKNSELQEILSGIEAAITALNGKKLTGPQQEFIMAIVQTGAMSMNGLTRLQSVKLIKRLDEECFDCKELLLRLTNDPRKSVRNAVLE